MRKIFLLAAPLALLALVSLGVAPASATLHRFESCLENEECKTSSVGTTFEGTEGEFVIENEEKVINKCALTVEGEIIDSTTEKKGDEMEASITTANLTSCSSSEVELNVPWTESIDAPTFEESAEWEIEPWSFQLFGCNYSIGGLFHTMLQRKELINRSYLNLGFGRVLKEGAGTPLCWSLLKDSFRYWDHLISDPGLPEATYILIE